MMKNKSAILLFSGLMIKSAFAAHPLSTEDATVLGKSNQQIEINTDRVSFRDQQDQVAALTSTYGYSNDEDLFANLPLNVSSPHGIGDISVGSKWQFLDYQGQLLVFKTELFLPTGDQQKGLGQGRRSVDLGLVDSYTRSAWTWHGNLVLTVNDYEHAADRQMNRKGVWRISSAVVYQANAQWALTADTGFTQADSKSDASKPVYVLGGVIYSPSNTLDLDAGLRRQRISGATETRFGVGLTQRY
ncbi:transporter [Undibacterium sp.]|uniref:transporter n=1 Tax=Undibacterium sp. TaxID=1914977 RepID=UPI00374DD3F5